ncbi:hypothetical protein NBRC116594_23060 [Shimia sp. NS0008-38b]
MAARSQGRTCGRGGVVNSVANRAAALSGAVRDITHMWPRSVAKAANCFSWGRGCLRKGMAERLLSLIVISKGTGIIVPK